MKTYLLCFVDYEERIMKDAYLKTSDASIFPRLHSEAFTPKIFSVDLCLSPYNPLKILAYIYQTFAVTFEWNAPCYIHQAGWFTNANRIHYESKTVERQYIQEEPRMKAIAKEKSHFSRKSTHFQLHDVH